MSTAHSDEAVAAILQNALQSVISACTLKCGVASRRRAVQALIDLCAVPPLSMSAAELCHGASSGVT